MKRFLLVLGLFPVMALAAPVVRPISVRIPARPIPAKPAPARPAKPVHSDNSAAIPTAAILATQNLNNGMFMRQFIVLIPFDECVRGNTLIA